MMYKKLLILFLLFSTTSFAQLQTAYVKPIDTDLNYTANQDSSYIVRNPNLQLDKLLLFIGGTGSNAGSYYLFCQYAASIGFDVISISYPNAVPAASLTNSSDSMAFYKFRQEVNFGTQLSPVVNVDTLNSIVTRTIKTLKYLAAKYPSHNWKNYLIGSDNVDWSKVVVAGHSQGSGHACYLAKKLFMDRALMFAGPNDYSTYYSKATGWLSKAGVTPLSKQFVLLHQQDEVVPFAQQLVNIKALGILEKEDTTLIDNLTSPYSNSHALYTNLTPFIVGQYHNSMMGGNKILTDVWKYMLTDDAVAGIIENNNLTQTEISIFPNPVNSFLTIKDRSSTYERLRIFNLEGRLILEKENTGTTIFDSSSLTAGYYLIVIGNKQLKFFKN